MSTLFLILYIYMLLYSYVKPLIGIKMEINPGTETGKKLWEYLQRNPMDVNKIARLVGVSDPTIKRLLETSIEPGLRVKVSVDNFLKEQK
jgi:hypothetical protein